MTYAQHYCQLIGAGIPEKLASRAAWALALEDQGRQLNEENLSDIEQLKQHIWSQP